MGTHLRQPRGKAHVVTLSVGGTDSLCEMSTTRVGVSVGEYSLNSADVSLAITVLPNNGVPQVMIARHLDLA